MGASSKRRGGSDPSSIPKSKVKGPRSKDKASRDPSLRDSSSLKEGSSSSKKQSRSISNTNNISVLDKEKKIPGSDSRHDRRYGTLTSTSNAKSMHGNGNGNGNSTSNRHNNRKKIVDTSLLARGMTSRTIGIRVSNNIKPLSPTEVERDIRHMEAYGAACVSYAQQLFAFSNRELVTRGHFGPAPPAPGMTFSQPANGNPKQVYSQPSVTMPVRIDPEEEKRLALLRKRVAASEAKREVLETEYLSLRAHYVHESHKLRRARSAVTGEVKLLRELLERRGDALAMRRVKCAVAREILEAFEFRGNSAAATATAIATASGSSGAMSIGVGIVEPENVGSNHDSNDAANTGTASDGAGANIATSADNTTPKQEPPQGNINNNNNDTSPMEGVETETSSSSNKENSNGKTDKVPADLVDIWSLIESKLHETELSCTDIPTPDDLIYIKDALRADATALENAADSTLNGFRQSKSPPMNGNSEKEEEEDHEDHEKDGGKKKKSRSERAAKRGSEEDSDGAGSGGNRGSGSGGSGSERDKDDSVIPWSCRLMPRTPYGVALYLSNLSRSPELAAAFACDELFGSKPQSLAWLESNLPVSAEPGAEIDAEKLKNIREEVEMLSAELKKEVDTNSRLHKEAIEGRKRSNEICAMMTMIRSETEGVIQRHNQIIEMNEDEEAEMDRNGDGDDEGAVADAEAEEGEIEDEDNDNTFGEKNDRIGDDNGNGPVLEVIVPSHNAIDGRGDQLEIAAANKRGYANAEDSADPDKKRRKV